MASYPPSDCCTKGFLHDGTPTGCYIELGDSKIKTYVTKPGFKEDRIIVILPDIFGIYLPNTLMIADQFACKSGYTTYIPDILLNDHIDYSLLVQGKVDINTWKVNHTNEITRPVVEESLKKIKEQNKDKKICVIGYCFGAKFAVQQLNGKDGFADVGAIAHPSGVTIEEVAAISKPILFSCAENDDLFPMENLVATIEKLKENKATYQLDFFSGVSHGFAARGDPSDKNVKYAKEKVFADQTHWFDYHLK
ncbi:alpha/beta-hydrolase [Hanseniaspora valbyensis NRRL Y-1626]|uniref:Alpha/beta-hydrolase n=1 Tax=Hanseniaspora valbyensis NRRL Y-1626 TaxID=766949 RepID=A0A1B7TAN9_9ASCO|nr:alpha/beta-hydrolase [Hanseniaspora valbyensis NRRL Y-1626]